MSDKVSIEFCIGFLGNRIPSDPASQEAWQTLKAAVLAQQTNNLPIVPCRERIDCIHACVCSLGACGGLHYRNG